MVPEYERHGIVVDELSRELFHERRDRQGPIAKAFGDAGALARIILRLTAYLRRHRIDIIDARGAHATFIGSVAARAAGVKAVTATSYDPHLWTQTLGSFLGAAVLARLGAFITDSVERRDGFQALLSRPHARALVIPNGIHPPISPRPREAIREELGLAPDAKVIGQVGRLIRFKGQEDLLRAARPLLEEDPKAAVLIVGHANRDPDYLDGLHRLARDLGIEGQVSIGGYQGPVADVWRAVDIHAHPSHYDSSPIAIHESMALGLPVVSTRVGGIPELVVHEQTGLLHEPGDLDALTDALRRLLQAPQEAEAMGAAGRERYEAHHSAEVMTRAIEKVMSELVKPRADGERCAAPA